MLSPLFFTTGIEAYAQCQFLKIFLIAIHAILFTSLLCTSFCWSVTSHSNKID